jgi:hypothetical protein
MRICSMYLRDSKGQLEVRIILARLEGPYFVFGGAAYGRRTLAVQQHKAGSRVHIACGP